jgi:uncharacterized protein YegL
VPKKAGIALAQLVDMTRAIFAFVWISVGFGGIAIAQTNPRCESIFASQLAPNSLNASATSGRSSGGDAVGFYKKSDLSARPHVWLRIRRALEKNFTRSVHPLEAAGQDADRIGAAYKAMGNELPVLKMLLEVNQEPNLSLADFIALKHLTGNELIRVAKSPRSDLEIFAALESLRLISTIETRVEFPKSAEEIRQEKKQEAKKKKEKKKQPKIDEQEQEQEAQWGRNSDKYNPENKDISSDGGAKKKNAHIASTDAELVKHLLRQKIYEQFDLKDWTSVPILRGAIIKDSKPSRKLTINPLNEKSIHVPVPYGYTLQSGKTAEYEIVENGFGEFEIHFFKEAIVTLDLFKIQRESNLPGFPRTASAEELAYWPQSLLLFTQSLKGLSAIDAATQLEAYLSKTGGFLYYSKGDQMDADELAHKGQEFQALLRQMPKPMAMANAGSFNCDGAAWIGALLLRDVLHLPVRIAAGRTSAGFEKINGVRHHVVRSSDPSHAWLEVFDGQNWLPFDMTPKNNTPDSNSAPSDLERDEDEDQPPPSSDQEDEQDAQEQSAQKKDQDAQEPTDPIGDKDKADKDKADKDKDSKEPQAGEKSESDEKKSGDGSEDSEISEEARQVEDIIKAKSTQRQKDEAQSSMIERVLARTELMALEHLINEGYQTSFTAEAIEVFKSLEENPIWRNPVERSANRVLGQVNDAKFMKFTGLHNLLNEARAEFAQNRSRDALQKLFVAQKLIQALSERRNLTRSEVEALNAIQKIVTALNTIKHEHSKEFDVVDGALKNLPGNVSKEWLRKQYGADFQQLGSAANLKLAEDLTNGRLKPILEMGAVSEFVDLTLNSTPEPRWKDEPTFNRAIVPKPRQDMVITRNPLDFSKMLWNLRPGENLFAPTLQGRQFALGSLETHRIPNPLHPIERKVNVIYYDISGSMSGMKAETVDSLLMAFVDKALSETDAIGRPTQEIYILPFNTEVLEGVHISSREDALNFLSKKMNLRAKSTGGTDIQKVVENFYELIANSYRSKGAMGRAQLFQKANMILFTDGGAKLDLKKLEEARNKIPSKVEISMNVVSIGDDVNDELKVLASNAKLSTTKPMFRQMNSRLLTSIVKASAKYDPSAFATEQKISGSLLAAIHELLQKINVDAIQAAQPAMVDKVIGQVQITKLDVRQLTGLNTALHLEKIEKRLLNLKLNSTYRHRLLEAILEAYPQLAGRSWSEMTFLERDSFEKLRKWSRE